MRNKKKITNNKSGLPKPAGGDGTAGVSLEAGTVCSTRRHARMGRMGRAAAGLAGRQARRPETQRPAHAAGRDVPLGWQHRGEGTLRETAARQRQGGSLWRLRRPWPWPQPGHMPHRSTRNATASSQQAPLRASSASLSGAAARKGVHTRCARLPGKPPRQPGAGCLRPAASTTLARRAPGRLRRAGSGRGTQQRPHARGVPSRPPVQALLGEQARAAGL